MDDRAFTVRGCVGDCALHWAARVRGRGGDPAPGPGGPSPAVGGRKILNDACPVTRWVHRSGDPGHLCIDRAAAARSARRPGRPESRSSIVYRRRRRTLRAPLQSAARCSGPWPSRLARPLVTTSCGGRRQAAATRPTGDGECAAATGPAGRSPDASPRHPGVVRPRGI